MTTIVVSGSRNWMLYSTIYNWFTSQEFEDPVLVVHGNAEGVDKMAGIAATALGFRVKAQPARWRIHDRSRLADVQCHCPDGAEVCYAAGPRRNQLMLDWYRPDRCVVFRSAGESKGTDDMLKRMLGGGYDVDAVHAVDGYAMGWALDGPLEGEVLEIGPPEIVDLYGNTLEVKARPIKGGRYEVGPRVVGSRGVRTLLWQAG